MKLWFRQDLKGQVELVSKLEKKEEIYKPSPIQEWTGCILSECYLQSRLPDKGGLPGTQLRKSLSFDPTGPETVHAERDGHHSKTERATVGKVPVVQIPQ